MILIKFPHIIMVEISLFFSKMDSKIQDFQREKIHFFGKCLSNFLWFWKNFLPSSRSTLVRFFGRTKRKLIFFRETKTFFLGEILSFFWRKFPFFSEIFTSPLFGGEIYTGNLLWTKYRLTFQFLYGPKKDIWT